MCSQNNKCNDISQLTANTGIVGISTANPNLDGNGSTTVLTAAANGTIVKSVTIKATEPVKTGMVRLFIEDAVGTTRTLYKEIPYPPPPSWQLPPRPHPCCPPTS